MKGRPQQNQKSDDHVGLTMTRPGETTLCTVM